MNQELILQKQCVYQTKPNLCGFHALYNVANFLGLAITFQEFHIKTTEHLINNYPNKKEIQELQEDGELQRFHLDFLLNDQKYLQEVNLMNIIKKTFFFGFRVIQSAPEELDDLQKLFNDFHQQQGPNKFVLFCGITIHWIAFIVEKDFQGQCIIYYLDSKNHNIKYLLSANYQQLIQDYIEREGNLQKEYDEIQLLEEFLKDLHLVIKCLQQFIFNNEQIATININLQIEELFYNVDIIIGKWEDQPIINILLQKTLFFLEHEYRPQVIRNMVYESMIKVVQQTDKQLKIKMKKFCFFLKEVIDRSKEVLSNPSDDQQLMLQRTKELIDDFLVIL